MSRLPNLPALLLGADPRMRRMVAYWFGAFLLYAASTATLWLEVLLGRADGGQATWLTLAILVGVVLFYGLIRAHERLALSFAGLSMAQGVFAVAITLGAYSVMGNARGVLVSHLAVVLVFCAFSMSPQQSRWLSLLGIVALGLVMLLMQRVDPARHPPEDQLVQFIFAIVLISSIGALTATLTQLRRRLKAQKAELGAALERIQTLATTDELTRLANRRHMGEVLKAESTRHARQGEGFCLALIDIDHFKRINDTWGHATGDDVLRASADLMRGAVRASDLLARWGGEEFLLLLPHTDKSVAQPVLERMRAQMAALPLDHIDPGLRVTFSVGLAAWRPGESVAAALERADRALYRAKADGRDRVVQE